MNPLKKTILALLAGLAAGLYITPARDPAQAMIHAPMMAFYAIGVAHGWQIVKSWAGKALSVGTDFGFWAFFLLLFRRGFMWGCIAFILLFSAAISIGCLIGFFVGVKDTFQYISGNREVWSKKSVFPKTATEAYLCILLFFLKYNIQYIEDNAVEVIIGITEDNSADADVLFESLNKGELDKLYHSIDMYKSHCINEKYREKSMLFMGYLMYLIDKEDKLTIQGKEFLMLLAECLGWGNEELEKVFKQKYGRDMPVPDVPSTSSSFSQKNDSSTRKALRTLGLPEDFDLNSADASSKVRQAYHEKAREYHPDLNPDEDGAKMVHLTDAFNYIQERYF